MKKKIALAVIVPALYWLSPAERFNIAEAGDSVYMNKADTQTQSQIPTFSKSASLGTSQTIAESYLKSAKTFIEGVERQTNLDVSLSNPSVQKGIVSQTRQALDFLHSAKNQVAQYRASSPGRMPASEAKNLSDTQLALDRAIGSTETLWNHATDDVYLSEVKKTDFRDQVKKVKDDIDHAIDKTGDLKPNS
jgi:hypothetical protein